MGITDEEHNLSKDRSKGCTGTNQQSDDKSLFIVQITDPHLRREEAGELLGMNTRSSLDAVLRLIRQNHPSPDVVLATGDLSQDGSVEAYRCFQDKVSFFNCPVYWFSGNHDNRDAMRQIVGNGPALDKVARLGAWQFIFLDSLLDGKVYGQLADAELELLDKTLAERPDLHAMICLHHHPVDIGCEWLDNIGLKNRERLLEVVDRHDSTRCIVWGAHPSGS